MDDLIIKTTDNPKFSPDVNLHFVSGEGSIQGESYQEDSRDFYTRIATWFDNYFQQKDAFKLSVDLSYINSSSGRALVELFEALLVHKKKGKKIDVVWYFEGDIDRDEVLDDVEDMILASGFDLMFTPK